MLLPKFLRRGRAEARRRKSRKEPKGGPGRPPTRFQAFWARSGNRILVLVGVVLTYFLLRPPAGIVGQMKMGQPSPRTIRSKVQFEYEHKKATERARRRAAEKEHPVFSLNERLVPDRLKTLDRLFERAAELVVDRTRSLDTRIDQLRVEFQEVSLSPTGWALLLDHSRDKELRNALRSDLAARWNYIAAGEAELEVLRSVQSGIDIQTRDGKFIHRANPQAIPGLTEAGRQIRSLLASNPPYNRDVEAAELATELARSLLMPNLTYDREATEERRRVARGKLAPITKRVNKGELIIERGVPVDETTRFKLTAMLKQQKRPFLASHLAWLAEAWLGLWLLYVYLRRYQRDRLRSPQFFGVLLAMILLLLFAAQMLALLQVRLGGLYGQVGLLLPVGCLGILVTTLIAGRLAVLVTAVASLFAAQILGGDASLVIIFFFSSLAGIYKVVSIKKRTDLYEAGLWISAVAAVLYLVFFVIQRPNVSIVFAYREGVLRGLSFAVLSGVLSSAGALFFLPLLEDLFGVTTDLKLLEHSVKTESLKDLEDSAPGTYQHSIHVSTLAESAAESIGANPLLCRVASLYHDIGKVKKPQYFSENQTTAADKKVHSKISPNLSCLLIRNHVKDGHQLAEDLNLPQPLRDAIAQHHGTTLISYFYDKALSDNPGGKIKESDFRYTGPKPQTIENAIIMLADSIEAASRSLPSYGQGEIQLLVRKAINDKFMDGQFDECDLTLKDLHTLSIAFSNSLASLLHRRISYPSSPWSETDGKKKGESAPAEKTQSERAE